MGGWVKRCFLGAPLEERMSVWVQEVRRRTRKKKEEKENRKVSILVCVGFVFAFSLSCCSAGRLLVYTVWSGVGRHDGLVGEGGCV